LLSDHGGIGYSVHDASLAAGPVFAGALCAGAKTAAAVRARLPS
jgi:hypothetical protein